jgi:hypothetical protein
MIAPVAVFIPEKSLDPKLRLFSVCTGWECAKRRLNIPPNMPRLPGKRRVTLIMDPEN